MGILKPRKVLRRMENKMTANIYTKEAIRVGVRHNINCQKFKQKELHKNIKELTWFKNSAYLSKLLNFQMQLSLSLFPFSFFLTPTNFLHSEKRHILAQQTISNQHKLAQTYCIKIKRLKPLEQILDGKACVYIYIKHVPRQ